MKLTLKSAERAVRKLCAPAYVYFILSAISIALLAVQNFGQNSMYCVGHLSCSVSNVMMVFASKIAYVLFWTWLLNKLCKMGFTNVSWFLVLLPFIMFFVLIGLFVIQQM